MKIVITGGSGFLANHLIKFLQENSFDIVDEIRTIDRKAFNRFLDYPNNITMTHYRCDLCDVKFLTKILLECDGVFHLARKSFEYLFHLDQHGLDEQYIRDNLKATECLVQAMISAEVSNLVYAGDAYANLPPSDNFGSSEVIHSSAPRSYLLGAYGASRTQSELYLRKHNGYQLRNGNTLNCVLLRPTFIYGEGEQRLPEAFSIIAQQNGGLVTHFAGSSNGRHQYIYAGSVAKIMDSSMRCLFTEPEKCSGAFFYCMDDMRCTKFTKFFEPIIKALGFHIGESKDLSQKKVANKDDGSRSYFFNYSYCVLREFALRQFPTLYDYSNPGNLSSYALRFFFAYCIGFSDRKMRLIFNSEKFLAPTMHTYSVEQSVTVNTAEIARHISKTSKWVRETLRTVKVSKVNDQLCIVPEEVHEEIEVDAKYNNDRVTKDTSNILRRG